MYDEGVHFAGFGAEARDAIAAGFGGAEFELEEGLVSGSYDAEVVRHGCDLVFQLIGRSMVRSTLSPGLLSIARAVCYLRGILGCRVEVECLESSRSGYRFNAQP